MSPLHRSASAIIAAIIAALSSTSCHPLPEWPDDPHGNFEALWTILDEHYCFFAEKNIDWDSIHNAYAPRISQQMSRRELFTVCAEMLDELRDGHTNLSSPFATSYYRQWWSAYPDNCNWRRIEQDYLNYNYFTTSGLNYAILPSNVGYIRYNSFSTDIGEGNLDYVLQYLSTCTGLIIDVRNNGGGSMTNVETLVRRFITQPTLAGYICHKTGPGHDDFSTPEPYYFEPAPKGRVMWGKPVAVLAGRGTFSAANNFVSVMQYLPRCRIVGATTGGGSGMPFNSELPCGWGVRFSACPVLDAMKHPTEHGVAPSPGCVVDYNALNPGPDAVIDHAVELLTTSTLFN